MVQCIWSLWERKQKQVELMHTGEGEHNLIKARPVGKVFRSQEISSKYLFIYGFAEKFSTSCV